MWCVSPSPHSAAAAYRAPARLVAANVASAARTAATKNPVGARTEAIVACDHHVGATASQAAATTPAATPAGPPRYAIAPAHASAPSAAAANAADIRFIRQAISPIGTSSVHSLPNTA